MEGNQFRIKNEKSKTKLSLNQRVMEKMKNIVFKK